MPTILPEILKPSVVTKIVSRIRAAQTPLANFFGVNVGGSNVEAQQNTLGTYTYDIYDNVRRAANFRLRGAPAGTIAANPVGNNTVTLLRGAEKLPLDLNYISSMRRIGENAGTIDDRGRKYVEKQAMTLNQRQNLQRELLIGSIAATGGLTYFFQSGDDIIGSYTSSSASYSNDLKIPSSHKLNVASGPFGAGMPMGTGADTITHTWATTTNDIPLMLAKVSAGFESSVGQPLMHVFCNNSVWNNVLKNDNVKTLAGTAASPFAAWTMEKGTQDKAYGMQTGRIKGWEWIEWHIMNHVLEVYNGSTFATVKVIPDDICVFSIEPGDWLKGVEGGEWVKYNDIAEPVMLTGFNSWAMERADPARVELHGLQNFGIELNIPKAVAVARVQ